MNAYPSAPHCFAKISGHLQSTQGMLLNNLALLDRGLLVLGLMGLKQLKKEFVADCHTQGMTHKTEHIPRLYLKEAYLLIQEPWPKSQDSGLPDT